MRAETKYQRYRRTHLKERRAADRRQRRDRVARRRAWVAEFKKNSCVDCGRQYPPYVMDFDHVRGRKRWSVAAAVAMNVSLTEIKREIAKCDLVCANCHRERTYGKETI